MRAIVLEKTRYILHNSWLGFLLPAGFHHLLSLAERNGNAERPAVNHRAHPAESRISRSPATKARP